MAFVHVENVSKTYSDQDSKIGVPVLRNVSAEIAEGEFV